MQTNRRNQHGTVLMNVLGAALIAAGVLGVAAAVSQMARGRLVGKERSDAHAVLAVRLEKLINLPTAHADLSATAPGAFHTDGNYEWEIADLTARLKRITLRAKLTHAGQSVASNDSVGQVGFRYDDY